jgi:hypothetical protein
MPKESPQKSGDNNLLIAAVIILGISSICAVYTAWVVNEVLNAFSSTEAMVMLITDSGIKSDDLKTERQLSEATLALQTSRDIAVALVVASLMMGVALAWRLWGQKANR